MRLVEFRLHEHGFAQGAKASGLGFRERDRTALSSFSLFCVLRLNELEFAEFGSRTVTC